MPYPYPYSCNFFMNHLAECAGEFVKLHTLSPQQYGCLAYGLNALGSQLGCKVLDGLPRVTAKVQRLEMTPGLPTEDCAAQITRDMLNGLHRAVREAFRSEE